MEFLWLHSNLAQPSDRDLPADIAFFDTPEALIKRQNDGGAAAVILEVSEDEEREDCLALIQDIRSALPVWVYDRFASVTSSIQWMKAGADQLATSADDIRKLISEYRETQPADSSKSALVGLSRSMGKIAAEIAMVANRKCNVLIEGETGTGKEVVARQIHSGGSRSRGPWVAVNCSAIPEALLEAELFGHTRGAFTGAVQSRAGKFEVANHGTIFLDEIGDMPLATQSKLLRVLQEREIERLGGNERIRLDVRVIAATNVDLAQRVRDGLFRQDLFYRLNVFRIELPPLRRRTEDIAALAHHFADKVCAAERLPKKKLDRLMLDRLTTYEWPGNVRELENVIEAAVIISGDRATLFPSDLRFARTSAPVSEASAMTCLPSDGLDYHRTLEEFEKNLLTQALARSRGNKTAAADLLRMKRTTLAARMRVLETRLPRLVA